MNTREMYYGMDGQSISQDEWAQLYKRTQDPTNDPRRVASTKIGDVHISTVLLGLDHSWGDGPPLIFETMIFGGEHDEYEERYATREQAEAGHARAVAMVEGA